MKKLIFCALALILGLTLSSSGCTHDSMGPDSNYIGTWKASGGGTTYTATFTSDNKFILESVFGVNTVGYIMENLTWTPITNTTGALFATYQTGYAIKGKVKAMTGSISIPKADGSAGSAAIGDTGILWWYISLDKRSIAMGDHSTPAHEAFSPPILLKQP